MATTILEDGCPALKEIKVCQRAIARLCDKWHRNNSQEEYFEAAKQIHVYECIMLEQSQRLVEQLKRRIQLDKEFYAHETSLEWMKMMKDWLENEQRK